MAEAASAVIVGVGPGLGAALARRFAKAGYVAVLAARRPERLQPILRAIEADGGRAQAHDCDATDKNQVKSLFAGAEQEHGPVEVAIYNAGAFRRAPIAELTADDYEKVWRTNAFGGFLVGREAARVMGPRRRGTILFTGATASLRGGAGFAAFAASKFALRALAQSMARELGPQGIHVAHVVIDGQIGRDAEARQLDPDAIAEAYHALHVQPRSAWTHELDLRPWAETF